MLTLFIYPYHPIFHFFSVKAPKIRLRKYHYLNETRTWTDARNYCRARFTDMATADTMSDVNRMMNIVDPGYNGSVWIGLERIIPTRWVWPSDSISVSKYSNWSPGEPNGNWECVKSLNGSWFDEDCALTLPFVCFNGESLNLLNFLSSQVDSSLRFVPSLVFVNRQHRLCAH